MSLAPLVYTALLATIGRVLMRESAWKVRFHTASAKRDHSQFTIRCPEAVVNAPRERHGRLHLVRMALIAGDGAKQKVQYEFTMEIHTINPDPKRNVCSAYD